jgi:hypothetical protein
MRGSLFLFGVNLPEMPYIFAASADPPAASRCPAAGEPARQQETMAGRGMARIFKLLVILLFLGFVALVGYAYLGDLSPERSDVRQPVELNLGK